MEKYLKIICSWILIFSICGLSLNVTEASGAGVEMERESQETVDFISDIENQETEPETETPVETEEPTESEVPTETETPVEPENPVEIEDSADQITDLDAPEQMSVQSLEEELLAVAENGEEASTDRVAYVDVNGNPIAGAPSVIKFGAIADHKELSIEGRHFEFKSAKVDGKNCVYIGKYNDTIYYSTDGVIAIKLEEAQKLTMMYQEYHLVSIKEVVPDSCTPGTITKKNGSLDAPLDMSNQIRVNAGENFVISVTPGTDTAKANNPKAKRFIIESVVSQEGATITKENGNENKATYSINFVKDDTITITYKEQSIYRITINTKDINGEEYINIPHSVAKGWKYLEGQDKIMWTFTPDDVYAMSGYELDIPAFHTKRGYRVINMVVNGTSVSSESGVSEVPISKGDTVSSVPRNLDLTTKMTDSYTTTRGVEQNCSYEYKMDLKVRTGKFEDYNFTLVPYKEDRGRQAVTVRLLTDGSRNGEGLDVVMWDYEKQALVPVKDNQTVDMDPVTYKGKKHIRQVRIFFAKLKAGYTYGAGQAGQITGVSYGQPHGGNPLGDGKKNAADAGTIDAMTATSLIRGNNSFKIYDEQWQAAKEAAIKGGYTRYIAWGGAIPSNNDWYLYDATFMVVSSGIYVHYNSGAGMGVLPKNADVKNIPDNPETRSYNTTPMHSYGKHVETGKGIRTIGTAFIMGEGWAEPTCEGYEFIGWKLKNKAGELSQETYSNGDLFTISDENCGYANNTDLPVFASKNYSGYQIVAQWKKIAKKEIKVEHYLKIPDGTEKLEKTTSGTISFSSDSEIVKVFANPEPDGTFPGYVFDEGNDQNTLEKDVKNSALSETVVLKLYYKPTVLRVSKTVEGYNQEPDKEFTFTLTATPPAGADSGTSQIKDGQIYITKGSKAKAIPLSFANNEATFTLKKDEFVDISCLPTGWTYKVSEVDPGKSYKTTYKINDGSATDGRDASFKMDKKTNIAFINKLTMEPPVTGRTLANNGLMVLMFFVLAISMVGMVFFKGINKKN